MIADIKRSRPAVIHPTARWCRPPSGLWCGRYRNKG